MSGTEQFDPAAFAERWYNEHPRAWAQYSQALARIIEEDYGEGRPRKQRRKAKVMTDEEISQKGMQFGKEILEIEEKGLEAERRNKRQLWVEFRNSLSGEQRVLAVHSYYTAYFQW